MIVKCETCGTHVPAAITVELTHAGKVQRFCSARCADQMVREPLPELPPLARRLLVAVDGSGPSVRAVAYAAALAATTGATMQLLLAIDTAALRPLRIQPRSDTNATTAAGTVERLLCEDAEGQLARCQRICAQAGVPYTMRIETKPPLEAILEAASGADLLVMGSRGRGALEAGSLGSLSQRVVTAARIPVLVVH
jgi:nucleotide-binding universal stress UspA family protein